MIDKKTAEATETKAVAMSGAGRYGLSDHDFLSNLKCCIIQHDPDAPSLAAAARAKFKNISKTGQKDKVVNDSSWQKHQVMPTARVEQLGSIPAI